MPIEKRIIDTREIQIAVPSSAEVTREFGEYICRASDDGYTITAASTISRGQRDPIVEGIRVRLSKGTP